MLWSSVRGLAILLDATGRYRHGQLLLDDGEVDEGLRVLSFVLSYTDRRGGFTCEIINPRVWEESTASVDTARSEHARQWARDRDLTSVVTQLLTHASLPEAERSHHLRRRKVLRRGQAAWVRLATVPPQR